MIDRYTLPKMKAVWSEHNKFAKWLQIELLACEAQAKLGHIPDKDLKEIKAKAAFEIERIDAIEAAVQHDVIAFLTNVSEHVGPPSRYIHMGMTSSDVLDTAWAVLMREAGLIILDGLKEFSLVLKSRAKEHKGTLMMGRSHGIHAEPTTFGLKLAMWWQENERNIMRMQRAVDVISCGKISGAVGTFAHIDPRVEEHVCKKLGLKPEPVATQIVPRDRHAHLIAVLAGMGSTCDRIATEIRHLQRTEVRELEEPFGKGQKGSSAMPHKRNPVVCERISGLARLLRGFTVVGYENVALWHERDISHSSAERVVFADAFTVLDYMIDRLRFVIGGLSVRPAAMARNLALTGGLVFSQKVLLALTEALGDREKAYRIVQGHAMAAWEAGDSFRDRLAGDPEVGSSLGEDGLAALFDVAPFLRNLDAVFERTLSTPWGRA